MWLRLGTRFRSTKKDADAQTFKDRSCECSMKEKIGKHVYRTKRWSVVRLQVLKRDGFMCQQCGSVIRLEVDHKNPIPKEWKTVRYDPYQTRKFTGFVRRMPCLEKLDPITGCPSILNGLSGGITSNNNNKEEKIMLDSQRLQIRISEIRSRLNEISGLEGEAFTEEIRQESDKLTTEFREVETKFRSGSGA